MSTLIQAQEATIAFDALIDFDWAGMTYEDFFVENPDQDENLQMLVCAIYGRVRDIARFNLDTCLEWVKKLLKGHPIIDSTINQQFLQVAA